MTDTKMSQKFIELSRDVLQELAKKYEKVRERVCGIMGGALLDTEARAIGNEGVSQGISRGIVQGEQLLASLMSRLFAEGRMEDVKLAVYDENIRNKLYKEYGMIK